MNIREGVFDDPQVIALLKIHLRIAASESPPESFHALDMSSLQVPAIRFWTAWEEGRLLGCAALKTLSPDHGELKSMHTAEAARGRGVGTAMLKHVIAEARAMGMMRLSLETGTTPYFRPAHRLYERHGFVDCGPFDAYVPDRNSRFMTMELGSGQ